MSSSVVIVSYLAAMCVAVFLLWRFSHVAWYWHALAVVVAVGLGLMPPVAGLAGGGYDVAIGSIFLFLLVWGAGESFFRVFHIHRHA